MKWLHNLLKGVSLTGALFVFQACYGTPQDSPFYEEGKASMSFSLVSRSTGAPLEGIRVKVNVKESRHAPEGVHEIGRTDAAGHCRVEIPYLRNEMGPYLTFEDPQGQYITKDTVLTDLRDWEVVIKMNVVQ